MADSLGSKDVGSVAWLTGDYTRVSHTFIMREVAALRELGLDVQTFSIRRTNAAELVGTTQRDEAARTFYVLKAAANPMVALRAHGVALTRAPKTWFRMLRAAWSTSPPGAGGRLYGLIYFHEAVVLASELRRRKITHLHNHFAMASCSVARLAAPLAGVTWSFTLHGPDDLTEARTFRLDDKVAQATFVVCISAYARSQVMLHSASMHWPKLHIVHCGIDPDRYRRQTAGHAGRLLFVGRLTAQKGVPILLAALAQALAVRPDLTLTLVGDGPDRPALEAQAHSLGLSEAITFMGYRNQDEVADLLAASSALVLPSFAEGVPVVLMEAMAAGLPVVATQIAGIPELVQDGISGKLVAPSDEDALAEAIVEVVNSQEQAEAMGLAGRRRVSAEFNLTTEASRLAGLVRWARHGGPRPQGRPAPETS